MPDIAPLSQQARGLASTEQVVGALFLAILIARLAADYPRFARRGEKRGSEDAAGDGR